MIDIRKYEKLVKLDLTEYARQSISIDVERELESFSALESIDTGGVEPLVTVLDMQNVLREDIAEKFMTREELLSNAPEQYDGYFQVPRTLE